MRIVWFGYEHYGSASCEAVFPHLFRVVCASRELEQHTAWDRQGIAVIADVEAVAEYVGVIAAHEVVISPAEDERLRLPRRRDS